MKIDGEDGLAHRRPRGSSCGAAATRYASSEVREVMRARQLQKRVGKRKWSPHARFTRTGVMACLGVYHSCYYGQWTVYSTTPWEDRNRPPAAIPLHLETSLVWGVDRCMGITLTRLLRE